MNRKQITI